MDLRSVAGAVAPVGARTQWEIGGPPPSAAAEVRAPDGITVWEPDDLTVTVGAGTAFADLAAELATRGQEVALDPADGRATVGGILACGCSGPRRLRLGPVRDQVLQVWLALADGRTVRGGGPTVKNVTGYDLPRLVVGSLGTLGVIERVTLRCRPRPEVSQWFTGERAAESFRPASRLTDGGAETVLLEGRRVDLEAQARDLGLVPVAGPPSIPRGPHRGRVSVDPGRLPALLEGLPADVRFRAEPGVGTVLVASDDAAAVLAVRDSAALLSGWMLREAGLPGDDGFGTALPVASLAARIKAAFDPGNRMNPGRLPVAPPPPTVAS